MNPLCGNCNNVKKATGKPGRSGAQRKIAVARSRKRSGSSANRKGMRTIMTSNHQAVHPGLKLAWFLTMVLGLGGWLRPAYGTERVWEKRFELPPGGHVSVVNVHGSVLVEGWDRAEVEATVAMRSETPTDQLDDVQVAVEAGSHGIEFHTLYPAGL